VSNAALLERLPHHLSGPVLNTDRRSEDVRFSPSGRRLLVATTDGSLLLFRLDPTTRPVSVEFVGELASNRLAGPHGVDWLSETEIIVANRRSSLVLFRLPDAMSPAQPGALSVIQEVSTEWFGAPGEIRVLNGRAIATGPGSVRVRGDVALVCCNHTNTVTAHTITRTAAGPECDGGRLVARAGIEVPDGVAHSPDGRWFAVSDHDNGRVLVYDAHGGDEFLAELEHRALAVPHGLVFAADGRTVLVADAGGPDLFGFVAAEDERGWRAATAHHVQAAVPREVFDRVQAETPAPVRGLEGGAKGIDLAPDGRTVVTTCRGQTLAFFQYTPPSAEP